MSPPYQDPFISQNQEILYGPGQPGLYDQQPMQQMQEMPPYYPFQHPYETYNDADFNQVTDMAVVAPLSRMQGDPPPLLSNNPPVVSFTLFKELTAYPNYGNPSRNADILYTGNRGTWTFESPAFLFVPGNLRAQAVIRAVLDDHYNVPVNRYSLRITINGRVVHDGRVPLEHGTPSGGMFNNWRELTFNVPNMRRNTQITIENTSTANPDDWIAFDWMQIKFTPRSR